MIDAKDLPALPGFDAATRETIAANATIVRMPEGARVFEAGQAAEAFLIITAGRVRVRLVAANGREIVLYKVEAGESCVLTTSCLLDAETHAADAICETAVTAIALPRAAFRRLMADSGAFRDAVLAAFAARVADLILTIEETRFRRVDARLAAWLADRSGPVTATHHDIAIELGSAREVITRTLNRFRAAGAIEVARGLIEVKNRDWLARQALRE